VHSSLCISLCGLSHKSSITFLLTELFNICRFKQASQSASWLCITSPRPIKKTLDSHCTLCSIYVCVSTTPSIHFVSKNVLETKLVEALNNKEIYLKSDCGTQLRVVNPDNKHFLEGRGIWKTTKHHTCQNCRFMGKD